MEIANLINSPAESTRPTIFAVASIKNKEASQCFDHYNGECFAYSHGKPPFSEVASKLAADTAIWGYKVVRLRPFYWGDKRSLLRRIFRSTNISVWQKRREQGFGEGLSASLAMVITGPYKFWWANVGDTCIYLYRGGKLVKLNNSDSDKTENLTKLIGVLRYGLVPQTAGENWLSGDIILISNLEVVSLVNEEEMCQLLNGIGDTKESVESAATKIVNMAQLRDNPNNFTVSIIKRIAVETLSIS